MTRDFLFDVGNVILYFDFRVALEKLRPLCDDGIENLTPVLEEVTLAYESGRLDDETFINRAIEVLGFRGTKEDFVRIWCDIFQPNQPIWDLVRLLAGKNHRLFLLSNTNGLHKDYFIQEYPVFEYFRGGVYSHSAQSMKPDAVIFETAISQFELSPGQTIYIDDREENIAAGNRHGLRSILYDPTRHHALLSELAAMDVDLS